MRIHVVIVSVLAMTVAACSPAQDAGKTASSPPYDFEKEKSPPPPPRNEPSPVADIEEIPMQPNEIEYTEAEAPVDSARVREAARPRVAGFRVQVFAAASEDVARSAQATAEARLGVTAYVDKVDGMYKVRVGDCQTREAAEALLQKARSSNYPDAWIVEGTVYGDRG